MSKPSLWYGYLEAGDKSSAVVLDNRLETGSPETVYLFNLVRNEILPYRRDVVEKKLRELTASEGELLKELKAAYNRAKRTFKARAPRLMPVTERKTNAREKQEPAANDAEFDNVFGLDVGGGGSDWHEDD